MCLSPASMGQRHTLETWEAVVIQNCVSLAASDSDHSRETESRAEGRRELHSWIPGRSSLRLAYSNVEGLTILLLMNS